MTKPVIGFIGLGLMGGNMVENLQRKGFELVVMDLNKDAVKTVIDRGNATEAASPKELAEASDIVMLCLTTSDVVEKLVYGDNGILAGISEGKVLIDFGTSIPASTRRIGADLAAKGASMTTVCTMSQAFAVADRAGVDRAQLYEIMSTGPSNSPFMGFCKNYAVDGVSDLGFSINDANKDLGYFLKMAEDIGTRAEIAEGTSHNLQAAVAAGLGAGNVPEIFDYFLKLER